MNIGDLKETIRELPDSLLVCGSGHFGESLEVYGVYVGIVDNKTKALVINIENPGEEPD